MHAISEATFDPPSETLQFVKETNVQLEDWLVATYVSQNPY